MLRRVSRHPAFFHCVLDLPSVQRQVDRRSYCRATQLGICLAKRLRFWEVCCLEGTLLRSLAEISAAMTALMCFWSGIVMIASLGRTLVRPRYSTAVLRFRALLLGPHSVTVFRYFDFNQVVDSLFWSSHTDVVYGESGWSLTCHNGRHIDPSHHERKNTAVDQPLSRGFPPTYFCRRIRLSFCRIGFHPTWRKVLWTIPCTNPSIRGWQFLATQGRCNWCTQVDMLPFAGSSVSSNQEVQTSGVVTLCQSTDFQKIVRFWNTSNPCCVASLDVSEYETRLVCGNVFVQFQCIKEIREVNCWISFPSFFSVSNSNFHLLWMPKVNLES